MAATGVRTPSAPGIAPASLRPDAPGCVVELLRPTRSRHEGATGRWVSERIARLLDYRYGGVHEEGTRHDGPLYFVPNHTLLLRDAHALHIASSQDLLGGVVPHPFVATKSITHGLIDDARDAPDGWAHELGAALDEVTLPGFTAFGVDDAARAGRALLEQGYPLRIKPGDGVGGLGQTVASNRKAMDAVLTQMDPETLRRVGVVIELNLKPVKTYSVGMLEIGPHRMAYFGMQSLTHNSRGTVVYGGSTLTCLRGGLNDLLAILEDEAERCVLRCAIRYDAEVSRAYPDFFASRRNYDVALGVDPSGMPRTGVLEQSWRIGGATPAEVLALEAMRLDERLQRVKASTHEVYELIDPPIGAEVSFRDHDPVVGAMTKYAVLDAQDDAHGR